MKYKFTNCWFDINKNLFEQELLKFKDDPILVLEVGCYEGRSSVWLIDNILEHPSSQIDIIDPFLQENGEKIKETFQNNIKLSKYPNKVTFFHQVSEKIYPTIQYKYNIAFIDGSHYPWYILYDMIHVWDRLTIGGLMICDDYASNNRQDTKFSPKEIMHYFLTNVIDHNYRIQCSEWSLCLMKLKSHTFKPHEYSLDHWKKTLT